MSSGETAAHAALKRLAWQWAQEQTFVGRHLQFDPAAKLRPSVEYLRNHHLHHGWHA